MTVSELDEVARQLHSFWMFSGCETASYRASIGVSYNCGAI